MQATYQDGLQHTAERAADLLSAIPARFTSIGPQSAQHPSPGVLSPLRFHFESPHRVQPSAPPLPTHDHKGGAQAWAGGARGRPLPTLLPPAIRWYHTFRNPQPATILPTKQSPSRRPKGPNTHYPAAPGALPPCSVCLASDQHAPPPPCSASPARQDHAIHRIQTATPAGPFPAPARTTCCCQAPGWHIPDAIHPINYLGTLTHASTCARDGPCWPNAACSPYANDPRQVVRPLHHVLDQLTPIHQLPTLTGLQAQVQHATSTLQYTLENLECLSALSALANLSGHSHRAPYLAPTSDTHITPTGPPQQPQSARRTSPPHVMQQQQQQQSPGLSWAAAGQHLAHPVQSPLFPGLQTWDSGIPGQAMFHTHQDTPPQPPAGLQPLPAHSTASPGGQCPTGVVMHGVGEDTGAAGGQWVSLHAEQVMGAVPVTDMHPRTIAQPAAYSELPMYAAGVNDQHSASLSGVSVPGDAQRFHPQRGGGSGQGRSGLETIPEGSAATVTHAGELAAHDSLPMPVKPHMATPVGMHTESDTATPPAAAAQVATLPQTPGWDPQAASGPAYLTAMARADSAATDSTAAFDSLPRTLQRPPVFDDSARDAVRGRPAGPPVQPPPRRSAAFDDSARLAEAPEDSGRVSSSSSSSGGGGGGPGVSGGMHQGAVPWFVSAPAEDAAVHAVHHNMAPLLERDATRVEAGPSMGTAAADAAAQKGEQGPTGSSRNSQAAQEGVAVQQAVRASAAPAEQGVCAGRAGGADSLVVRSLEDLNATFALKAGSSPRRHAGEHASSQAADTLSPLPAADALLPASRIPAAVTQTVAETEAPERERGVRVQATAGSSLLGLPSLPGQLPNPRHSFAHTTAQPDDVAAAARSPPDLICEHGGQNEVGAAAACTAGPAVADAATAEQQVPVGGTSTQPRRTSSETGGAGGPLQPVSTPHSPAVAYQQRQDPTKRVTSTISTTSTEDGVVRMGSARIDSHTSKHTEASFTSRDDSSVTRPPHTTSWPAFMGVAPGDDDGVLMGTVDPNSSASFPTLDPALLTLDSTGRDSQPSGTQHGFTTFPPARPQPSGKPSPPAALGSTLPQSGMRITLQPDNGPLQSLASASELGGGTIDHVSQGVGGTNRSVSVLVRSGSGVMLGSMPPVLDEERAAVFAQFDESAPL